MIICNSCPMEMSWTFTEEIFLFQLTSAVMLYSMAEIWYPESIALQHVNLLLVGSPHLAVYLQRHQHSPLCHLLPLTWILLLYLVFQIRSSHGTQWCHQPHTVNTLKISQCHHQWLVLTMAHCHQCPPWIFWWTEDGGLLPTQVQVYLQCSKTFDRHCFNKLLRVSWICGGTLDKGQCLNLLGGTNMVPPEGDTPLPMPEAILACYIITFDSMVSYFEVWLITRFSIWCLS